jgi:glutamyl-tRNA reductase
LNSEVQQVLFTIGVNHKTAPLDIRERLFINEKSLPEIISVLKNSLHECMLLSTCNRTELYGVTSPEKLDNQKFIEELIRFTKSEGVVKKEHFFSDVSCTAAQKLFSIASGIDSKIIGDSQILQQLKNAYFIAKENNATGKVLNQLCQRAFRVGKRAKAETSIHKGAISVSLASVELAMTIFGDLSDKSALIIGAGETSRLTAECLIKKNVGKIFVTNRTRKNAEEMVTHFSGHFKKDSEVLDFENFKNEIYRSDIVISSTSSADHILSREDVVKIIELRKKTLLLIDIAIPRDIDPAVRFIDNVILRNIDDLNEMVGMNFEKRISEIPEVKKIISKELTDFLIWYYSLPLMPAIKKIDRKSDRSEKIEEIKNLRKFLSSNVTNLHREMSNKNNRRISDNLNDHVKFVKMLYDLNKAI